MRKKRIGVGLSGGVDSSVAAYLLKQKGFSVIGFTLKFYPQENRCCDLDSLDQARRLCHTLGIAHYTLDVTSEFQNKVVDYFVRSYLTAKTPNPCAYCNRLIKFGIFFDKLKTLDIDYLATGHYARLTRFKGGLLIRRAKDIKKTQEYFLSLLKPEVLKSLIFPLGNYTKEQVKKIARQKKLIFKERKESQDVCFVADRQYPRFIEKYIPKGRSYSGEIRHINGKVLGKHRGIYYYTYGQRSGLGLAYKYPLYVLAVNSQDNSVIVGPKNQLYQDQFSVDSLNWFITPPKRDVMVKVRYNARSVGCRLDLSQSPVKVYLSEKVDAPTPGQLATFYYKDLVLGAGIIEKFKA